METESMACMANEDRRQRVLECLLISEKSRHEILINHLLVSILNMAKDLFLLT